MDNLNTQSEELERALLFLDKIKAEEIIQRASGNNQLIDVAGNLVSTTLKRIGDSWEEGKLSLSQVYMSGIICEELIDKLLPPQSSIRKSQPKMAIGVFEDYHLLGKRIIYSTLRASGFELMDLGGGLTVDRLVEIIEAENIKILLLSVLMLPSALKIKELKNRLKKYDVKIVVGGAPFRFDKKLFEEVGADATGNDPSEAIEIVNSLMNA